MSKSVFSADQERGDSHSNKNLIFGEKLEPLLIEELSIEGGPSEALLVALSEETLESIYASEISSEEDESAVEGNENKQYLEKFGITGFSPHLDIIEVLALEKIIAEILSQKKILDTEELQFFENESFHCEFFSCEKIKLIHLAAAIGHEEALQFLCERGTNINDYANSLNITPLALAAQQLKVESVHTLLNYGARVDLQDNEQMLPLHYAVNQYELIEVEDLAAVGEIIQLLMEKDSQLINSKDKDGYTPLHYAALKGPLIAVEVLLQYPIEIDALTHKQETALYLAVQEWGDREEEKVKLLLQKGADWGIPNEDNQSIMNLAKSFGFKKIETLILGAERQIDQYFQDEPFDQEGSIENLQEGLTPKDTKIGKRKFFEDDESPLQKGFKQRRFNDEVEEQLEPQDAFLVDTSLLQEQEVNLVDSWLGENGGQIMMIEVPQQGEENIINLVPGSRVEDGTQHVEFPTNDAFPQGIFENFEHEFDRSLLNRRQRNEFLEWKFL